MSSGSKPCRTWLPGEGNAMRQCICGHERHDGLCGKPRYATTDMCKCAQFVDAGKPAA